MAYIHSKRTERDFIVGTAPMTRRNHSDPKLDLPVPVFELLLKQGTIPTMQIVYEIALQRKYDKDGDSFMHEMNNFIGDSVMNIHFEYELSVSKDSADITFFLRNGSIVK